MNTRLIRMRGDGYTWPEIAQGFNISEAKAVKQFRALVADHDAKQEKVSA